MTTECRLLLLIATDCMQALPGESADFQLITSLIEPPTIDRGHQCDPNEPECRAPVIGSVASGALPSSHARSGGAAAAVALAATLVGGALARRGRHAR